MSGEDHSGSTAITVLLTPTHIICGNCGDSRAIAIVDGAAVALSEDHKPYTPSEQARIEAAGGTVSMRRVNGDLAVSRALGDYVYKQHKVLPQEQQQVSCEPEVREVARSSKDMFIVLACDGIWDVMSNEDVANKVMNVRRAARWRPRPPHPTHPPRTRPRPVPPHLPVDAGGRGQDPD